MNNARIVDMEIWGGDQNIIEGDPFAVGAENQTCVVVESGEGGVEWELEEGFERQGSGGVDVGPDGVGRDEPAQEGGVGCDEAGGPGGGEVVGVQGVGEVGKAAQGERSDDGVGAEGLGGWSDGQESYKE